MNKTKIDWCDMSWNPVTGCLHDCQYCYARNIANRFEDKNNFTYVDGVKPGHLLNIPYPYGFLPTLHPGRIDDPKKKTKAVTIFVCSMADLFGKWVPDEWINEVFKTCERATQHRYLFLTKNPKRYTELQFKIPLPTSDKYWFGTTVNNSADFIQPCRAEHLAELKGCKKFLSIEPILGEIHGIALRNLAYFQWIIVGAESGNRKGKVIPQKQWILDIKNQCKDAKVPLFMKESLRVIMGADFTQEYPW